MTKKIFIISGAIFLVILIALGVQYFWLNKTPEEITTPGPQTTEPTQPAQETPVSGQRVKKLVEKEIKGLVFNADASKLRYYQDKRFFEVDLDGATKNPVGAYPFEQVKQMHWAATKKHALVRSTDGWYVYDLDSDQATKLKSGVDVATWSRNGDKLVYKYFDANAKTRSLNVADPDGNNWREIASVEMKMMDFQVNPANGEICYYSTPDSFTSSQLLGVNFDGQNQRKIFEGKFGADFLWSPDGKKILISNVAEKGGMMMDLGVANNQGGEYHTLNFPTSVKKCVWSKDNVTIYCAMMVGMAEGDVLPNDWEAGKLQMADTFWKINTQNGKKDRLLELTEISQAFDADQLQVDTEERYLFFVDRKTGELYRIEL